MGRVAATPPMGWNSWDCFGTTVTEAEVLANARIMSDRLLRHGWDTIVVDIDWYDPTARSHGYNDRAPLVLDGYGRQLPAPGRFPSAAPAGTGVQPGPGFRPLADSLHALGLRFGLHLLRGIPKLAVERDLPVFGTAWTARDAADPSSTCPWNPHNVGLNHDHPAAQAYLDAQLAQLAEWGVDYLKVDDLLAPYHARDIEALALAIGRTGREIVLSLSPGTHLSTAHVEHLRQHAQLWRISDDLWDRWDDVRAQFARLARWAPLQRPGGWADADMLPIGRIGLRAERGEPRDSRLTLDEQRTLLTLWAMARSPLMIGGDLPSSSPATLDLLANPALGAVLRGSVDGRELLREPLGDGELIVWTAWHAERSLCYVALFWTGADARVVTVPLASLVGHRAAADGPWTAHDLWAAPPAARPVIPLVTPMVTRLEAGGLTAHVPPHGVVWLELAPPA